MPKTIAKAHPLAVSSAFLAVIALGATGVTLASIPITTVLPILTAALTLVWFGWLLSIGLYFSARLPGGPLVAPLLPKAAFALTLAFALSGVFPVDFPAGLAIASGAVAFVANFFLLWFGCCSLRSFELGRKASFPDLAGLFFLIWLLSIPVPVGPYIAQSRARSAA